MKTGGLVYGLARVAGGWAIMGMGSRLGMLATLAYMMG